MKIFLDSSVIIAALLSTTGASAKIIALCEAGIFDGYITDEIKEEVEQVLIRKFPEAKALFKKLIQYSLVVLVTSGKRITNEERNWITDPNDVKILLGARQSKAEVLITLDIRHFINDKSVAKKTGLKITTPGDFLENLYEIVTG